MLQQTQVSVVIPYFERWMDRFPTIEVLAAASEEEVVKMWEGLGYYSRARNLHAGAKVVGNKLPADAKGLSKIKGLGPYTIGAILSFAFHQKAAAVDGNVLRVISRYLGIEGDISKGATQNQIRQEVEKLLPDHNPWEVMEGLIELGAKVCRRKPACQGCPLQGSCVAYTEQRTDLLPFNSRKRVVTDLYRLVAVIRADSAFLVRREEEGQVMGGLYQFPYFEMDGRDIETCVASLGLEAQAVDALPEFKHTFTSYRAHLYPWLLEGGQREIPGYTWVRERELKYLPFSSGHRKILNYAC